VIIDKKQMMHTSLDNPPNTLEFEGITGGADHRHIRQQRRRDMLQQTYH
jgi:hypothetical protein